MEIKRYQNLELPADFVDLENSLEDLNIHQSLAWLKFQKSIPGREKIFSILAYKENKIVGFCHLVRMQSAWRQNWLSCQKGPVVLLDDADIFEEIIKEIVQIARDQNSLFVRIESDWEEGRHQDDYLKLTKLGFKKAHSHHQPENTLKLKISGTEEDILAQMKPKGRYNIRLAAKKGVEVELGNDAKSIEEFVQLTETTTSRNHFFGHGFGYFQSLLKILGELDLARLYLAKYEEKVIAGLIVTVFKKEAIYYFGASGNEYRNLMAPYLLQWEAIKFARSKACERYDFLGVAPVGAEKHPWSGVTDFKEKFGGYRVNYAPALEKPIKFWTFYLLVFLKKIRGFFA